MQNLFSKTFSNATLKPINDVATELKIEPYILRFWETKFPQITPVKGKGNRRLYSNDDISTIKQIKNLLYNQGFTIEGAKKYLMNSNNIYFQSVKKHKDLTQVISSLKEIKSELESLI